MGVNPRTLQVFGYTQRDRCPVKALEDERIQPGPFFVVFIC